MTEAQLATLQRAVTLAKDRQITTLDLLRSTLSREGHADEDIQVAISTWADYEKDKQTDRMTVV